MIAGLILLAQNDANEQDLHKLMNKRKVFLTSN